MTKFIKFLLYSIVILFVIWAFLAIFLSRIGLETKRFNPIIINQVKKYNDNLNLDIKTVKIYLNISSLTNPKIKVKFEDPTLILGKNKIGEKLYAVSPLKNKNIPVEIISSHYVDPKGERVRS